MAVVLANIDYLDDVQIIKTSEFKLNELNSTNIQKNKKKVILFVAVAWYKSNNAMTCIKNIFSVKKLVDYVVILYNHPSEKQFYQIKINQMFRGSTSCFDTLYCNHNAFVNENEFTITNDNEVREYTLVINARFSKYKNTNIAKKCDNTIHIGYITSSQIDIVIPTFGKIFNPDGKFVDHQKVNEILNNSMMGGIFSPIEGSCKASSEYLLAGLPCISIKNDGGRDIWYNDKNSIICQNTEDAVMEAINTCLEKLKDGTFDRKQIRDDHIKQSLVHRKCLTDYLFNKLEKLNIKLTDDEKQRVGIDIIARH
jgi:hypothetical protein